MNETVKNKQSLRKLCMAALFAALCYIGFTYCKIDIPVGAEKTAFILERAMAQFPGETVPELRHERQAVMDALPESVQEAWEALDQEFYHTQEPLDSLLTSFIRANQREFR